MVGPIDVKWKGSASVGYWVYYVTLTFDLTHDLDLGCFKVKFRNSSISGIVCLIDVKWKRSELIWYWADCMTLPFDHTHDLDPGVEISRSKSEIALSQEWVGGLTWNKKDVSHPLMTMILTSVTMVGWADVPDSDWDDFRRRRAFDISSLCIKCNIMVNVLNVISWFINGLVQERCNSSALAMQLRLVGHRGPFWDPFYSPSTPYHWANSSGGMVWLSIYMQTIPSSI